MLNIGLQSDTELTPLCDERTTSERLKIQWKFMTCTQGFNKFRG